MQRIKVYPKVYKSELAMDPIEISSSDSDLEMDDIRGDDRPTTNSRVLPSWASSSNGNLAFTG